jgi:hypothetical protein
VDEEAGADIRRIIYFSIFWESKNCCSRECRGKIFVPGIPGGKTAAGIPGEKTDATSDESAANTPRYVVVRIAFKSCNETVQKVISMVVDYMQEAG